MELLAKCLSWFQIHNLFELLSMIGLIYFLVNRFLLHRVPVPGSAFKKVSPELLEKCVRQLEKGEKKQFEPYQMPRELYEALSKDLWEEKKLKELLCSICDHLGINGSFIKLVLQETEAADKAGEISTDLAFTTIRLIKKPYYDLNTVTAILAHEACHLHLYYQGIKLRDTWENEVLTDPAVVYCGFGEYLYQGYAVRSGEFAFSYHKVGYIRKEDVAVIRRLMEE